MKCMNPGCNNNAQIKIGNKYTETIYVCEDCHQFITIIAVQSILHYLEDLIDDGVLLKRIAAKSLNPYGNYKVLKQKATKEKQKL